MVLLLIVLENGGSQLGRMSHKGWGDRSERSDNLSVMYSSNQQSNIVSQLKS